MVVDILVVLILKLKAKYLKDTPLATNLEYNKIPVYSNLLLNIMLKLMVQNLI